MTVNEALFVANEKFGNTVPQERLLRWLWEIEDTVRRETVMTHSGFENVSTAEITEPNDMMLSVPDPQSELYIHYLEMKNDMYLRDTDRYMNSALAFSAAYSAYADCINRTKTPKGADRIIL